MGFYKYAGFWRRFIAYMIDGFIIGMVVLILATIAGIAFFAGIMSGGDSAYDPEWILSLSLWIWFFPTLINIAYFTYFHGATGRTPGKSLLGVQVVSVEGNPISFGTAFLRSVGYMVSSFFLCLGFIWIGFDKKKQGWHDKIAGTVVIIREPQNSSAGISITDSSTVLPQDSQQMRQNEEFKAQDDQADKMPENKG
jgi:uncharacterized RDD family membrane protein YckC